MWHYIFDYSISGALNLLAITRSCLPFRLLHLYYDVYFIFWMVVISFIRYKCWALLLFWILWTVASIENLTLYYVIYIPDFIYLIEPEVNNLDTISWTCNRDWPRNDTGNKGTYDILNRYRQLKQTIWEKPILYKEKWSLDTVWLSSVDIKSMLSI